MKASLVHCYAHITGKIEYQVYFDPTAEMAATGGFDLKGEWKCDCLSVDRVPADKIEYSTVSRGAYHIRGFILIDMWRVKGKCTRPRYWHDPITGVSSWVTKGCSGDGKIDKRKFFDSFPDLSRGEFDYWGFQHLDCFKDCAGDDGQLQMNTELWCYLTCCNRYGNGMDGFTEAWVDILKHHMQAELYGNALHDWIVDGVECQSIANQKS